MVSTSERTSPTPVRDGAPMKRITILKNVVAVGVTFLCVFSAYQGLGNLQSTLHMEAGLGTVCQSLLYCAMIISSILLPHSLIALIGHKCTIVVSIIGYMTWMAANGYAVWATMVPTSLIVGVIAAPLWTAQSSYFTKLAALYAPITGERMEHVIPRFFGIFFMFHKMGEFIIRGRVGMGELHIRKGRGGEGLSSLP